MHRDDVDEVHEPVLADEAAPGRGLAAVVVLFLLGRTAPAAALAQALAPLGPDELVGLGLAETVPGGLRALVDLRPHAADDGTELWVASDLGASQRPGVLRRDLREGRISEAAARDIYKLDV